MSHKHSSSNCLSSSVSGCAPRPNIFNFRACTVSEAFNVLGENIGNMKVIDWLKLKATRLSVWHAEARRINVRSMNAPTILEKAVDEDRKANTSKWKQETQRNLDYYPLLTLSYVYCICARAERRAIATQKEKAENNSE